MATPSGAAVPELPNYEDFYDVNAAEQDKGLLVKFFVKAVQDREATIEAGRPIFRDVEYIDIRVPGSRDSVSRPAREPDKQRFPQHYAAFLQRREAPDEGTPLVEWPLITRSMCEELAFLNIKTVEQLAAVPDSHAGRIMGMGNMKRQAQEWLEDSKDDAPTAALTARLTEAESQLAMKDKTINELSERLAAMERSLARLSEAQAGSEGSDPAPAGSLADDPQGAFHTPLDSAEGGAEAEGAETAQGGADRPPPDPESPRGRRRRRRAAADDE